jgi:hypothetical protein
MIGVESSEGRTHCRFMASAGENAHPRAIEESNASMRGNHSKLDQRELTIANERQFPANASQVSSTQRRKRVGWNSAHPRWPPFQKNVPGQKSLYDYQWLD